MHAQHWLCVDPEDLRFLTGKNRLSGAELR